MKISAKRLFELRKLHDNVVEALRKRIGKETPTEETRKLYTDMAALREFWNELEGVEFTIKG